MKANESPGRRTNAVRLRTRYTVSTTRSSIQRGFARSADIERGRLMRVLNGLVLLAAGALWLASGSSREHAVLAPLGNAAEPAVLRSLESQVAEAPRDEASLRALAQSYIDARAPGMAVAVIEQAPADVRSNARVLHLYARALIEEGHAQDALAVEHTVLRTCTMADGVCEAWLIASARRRADILEELVALGVEDARSAPEASAVAWHNATREVRLAVR